MKKTIVKDGQEETVINKSRFICTLKKVQSEEEAQTFIKNMKKQYWDATHNCSAYIINTTQIAERSSDDGEPSGTAGLPMLEVLRKAEVINVAAVVTRYFGGVKLGAGGLVRAYTGSVSSAIKTVGLAQIVEKGVYNFLWNINDVGQVLNLLYQGELFTVDSVEYKERAIIKLLLLKEDKQRVEDYLTEILKKKIELDEEKLIEVEIPVEDRE